MPIWNSEDLRLQDAIRLLKDGIQHARYGRSDDGVQAVKDAYKVLAEIQWRMRGIRARMTVAGCMRPHFILRISDTVVGPNTTCPLSEHGGGQTCGTISGWNQCEEKKYKRKS